MATVAELLVKISGDSTQLQKEIAASKRQMKRAFGPDVMEASATAGNVLATALGGASAAMAALSVASIKMAASMEQNRIAFTTMLGSGEAAKVFLDNLAGFAEKTPFTFDGLVSGSKRMLAMGFAAEEILPMLTNIGDAVAAVGGGTEVLDRVTLAFAQMKAKGSVSAEEMKQLAEAGIPAWQMLANALNTDVATAMDLAEKKAIDADGAIAGMMSQMASKYGGMMEQQANTVMGKLSNIQDAAGTVMRQIGEDLTQAFDIKPTLDAALNELNNFKANVKAVGIKQAILDEIPAPTVFTATFVTVELALASLIAVAGRARLAMLALWGTLGPIGIAIGVMSAIVADLSLNTDTTTTETERLNGAIEQEMNYMSATGDEADALAKRLQDLAGNANTATKAMAHFNANAQEHRNMSTEKWFPDPPKTPGGAGGQTEKEARQIVKAQADYEIAVARDKASLLIDIVKSQEEEMDRQRKNGLSGVREYWSKRETEDTSGLAVIKAYWDKRNSLQISGVNAELDALKKEKTAIESQMTETSDPSDTIALKRELLGVTTQITLKERELGTVLKKNTELANDDSMSFITKYAELLNSTKKTMNEMSASNVTQGLKGSAKGYAEIETDKTARLKAVQDVVDGWSKGLATIKDEYGVTVTDTVGMEKWRSQQNEIINAQSLEKRNEYYKTASDIRADIDAAYNANSLSQLQSVLTAETAMRLSQAEGEQAMMDVYRQIQMDANRSTMSYMAEAAQGLYGGLTTLFTGLLDGTKSLSDAWAGLGKSVAGIIAQMAAQWIASRLMMAVFGKTTMAGEVAAGAAAGAAMAAAWAPAAAMVSLATFGANSGPAIAGITATNITAMGFAIPALANGGITTGPSIAMIGDNKRYDEVVMPLDKKVFEKMGITSSEQQPSGDQYHFTIHALDGPSVKRILMEEGATIVKSLKKQARAFNVPEVSL